ncbi:hypothetical protein [Hasllibacter sp. MH4015]|uniref:hypothetical protein n=1 Tax=Hasllibacter sp. MH4015 TaxID=2854029 RepID=UPI001CD1C347|nr:hypothetical protein [Hasllibacter sp. MH4015]
MRLILPLALVTLLPSCAILGPLFGIGERAEDASPYQAAMADFSLCETAPDPAARQAAAARLAQAAALMQADTQPTNPDHFYEMDRVTAADARCQSVLPGN